MLVMLQFGKVCANKYVYENIKFYYHQPMIRCKNIYDFYLPIFHMLLLLNHSNNNKLEIRLFFNII